MDNSQISQSNTDGMYQPMLTANRIFKMSLAISGLILLAGAFYGGIIMGKNSIKLPISSDVSEQTQKLATSRINQVVRIYSSLNRNFSLYLYSPDDQSKCLYGIEDKQGYKHDISKALGTDKITCSEGMGNISSSFVNWVDGNKFLLDEKVGEIKIVDVANFAVESYKYDASKFDFIGANRSLKYWLFRKIQEKNTSYILLDRDTNVALDNINFESNDRGAQYDEVNDGFLFIDRTFTEESVSTKFDFLSMNDLKLKNILTTEPVEAFGRGCSSEYLLSEPGKVILTPGCLTVGDKYLGTDGNIHIKL